MTKDEFIQQVVLEKLKTGGFVGRTTIIQIVENMKIVIEALEEAGVKFGLDQEIIGLEDRVDLAEGDRPDVKVNLKSYGEKYKLLAVGDRVSLHAGTKTGVITSLEKDENGETWYIVAIENEDWVASKKEQLTKLAE